MGREIDGSATGQQSNSPLRVLIADDRPDWAESVALWLSRMGCASRIVADGGQALARARSWQPHVCVLDLDTPQIDGREVARQIRSLSWGWAERPVLVGVSGWTLPANKRTPHRWALDHHLCAYRDGRDLLRIIQASAQARAKNAAGSHPAEATEADLANGQDHRATGADGR